MLTQTPLAPRFTSGPYGAGDTVDGVIVAAEPMGDLRSMNLYLRYVGTSPSFAGGVTHDSLTPFHQGPLAAGQEVPFSLRLPEDALPNWEDPRTDDYGKLAWSLVMETDVAGGLDRIVTRPIPVVHDASRWPGPAPANQPRVNVFVDDWDVSVEPDRWSLHRGEELALTLRIGKPKSERPKLEVMLACQVVYRVEVHEPTSSTGDYKNVTKRQDLFLERPDFDPSLPEQTFTFRIPEDVPFSHEGTIVSFEWFFVAKEARRWFQGDAGREAYIEVLP